MLNSIELIAWLEETNRRYSAGGIPHKMRPLSAMSDFTREHRCSLAFDHPTSKPIFEWFCTNSPLGAHQVGAVFTGVYFYDTAFWPVHVPITLGHGNVNALNCLETMPQQIKKLLVESHPDMSSYLVHWVNCMDYGYGQMELESIGQLRPRAFNFFSAAHSELTGALAQLLIARPNFKAILGLRMATEILLKSVLLQELDLNDNDLRKLSHKLEDAAAKCAEATNEDIFNEIAKCVSLYPPVSTRYEDTDWPALRVWQAASLTQLTAATVTRRYTERDMRAALQ